MSPRPPDSTPDNPAIARPGASHGMGRAVRVFSALTLLSRFGGLARDAITARIFGATAIGSAFVAAFAIPNLFRRLLGEGALAAAFLPVYTRLDRDDPELARRFAAIVLRRLALTTGLITVVVELGLLATLWLDGQDADRALSVRLIMVMFPFMPTVCLAAILGAMLQAHGRFGPSAAMPILLNLFTIIAAVPFVVIRDASTTTAAYVIGIATVLSGVAQVVWGARALGDRLTVGTAADGATVHVREMMRKFVPVVIGLGALQISSFLDTVIAMWPNWVGPTMFGRTCPLDESSNSILGYAQRLYQFPLGVFGVAVATAIFPMLARAEGDNAEFSRTLRRGLRLSLFIGLPASVGLVLVRQPLTFVVYGGGDRGFGAADVARAGAVLAGYAPAIWAFSVNQVWTRAFYASGDTRTPMRVAIAMVSLNLVLNLALIWSLREAGLAWATSACAVLQCVVLAALMKSRLGHAPLDRETLLGAARLMVMTAAMGLCVWAAIKAMPARPGWLGNLATLSVAAATGVGSYIAMAIALRLPELSWLLDREARKRAPRNPSGPGQDETSIDV